MATIEYRGVTKRFDAHSTAVDDLSLSVDEGEFLILVGPSGCGKTTALRMAAGLEEVTSGEIQIGGRIVNDLPPAERDIAMVFQNYALYPHMTVRDNLAFPLKQQRLKRAEIAGRVRDVAQLLEIEPLLDRRPKQLSGGQRQRVAIGRALVRRPTAFLMDEPLSNLDAKLRVQMRAELIALHHRLGITTLYVTHDQTEAMTLGDRVVVLDAGVMQQSDTPERLYREPLNIFVAGFIGSPPMNLMRGVLAAGVLRLGPHSIDFPTEIRDADVIVGLRPEDITLAHAGDASAIPAVVEITEMLGPELLAHMRVDGLETEIGERSMIVARLDPNITLHPGEAVGLVLDRARVRLFDRTSGVSLDPR
ncbi:MAG TPA: ABC transporter ATP-binding protein [Gaiellaceae bacterium]|jgi:ABC-type sugar transport system ATPase subunit